MPQVLESFRGVLQGVSPGEMLAVAFIIIVATGLIGGLIARRFRQPLLLGYILAGVFVGIAYKAGFGEAANTAIASLADIGVALLLFSMGLEFKREDLRPVGKIAVRGTFFQVLFTLLAGAGIAYLLDRTTHFFPGWTARLIFGTAFISTSTAVVLKTLTGRGRMGTLSSKVIIGMSIVQDLMVIPLFLLFTRFGDFSSGIAEAAKPLVSGAVFIALMMTLGTRGMPLLLRAVAKFNSRELFLLAVTALALGSGLLAETMDVSFSFGAFLAGIALSPSAFGKKAIGEVMPVRDLFSMLFFVSIGMMLDSAFLINHFGTVILLMLATSFARTSILALITWCSGYRNVIPAAMFFGMVPTSEIAFVVIRLARRAEIFPEEACSLILCVIVCSMLAGPLFDGLTAPVYDLLKKTLWKKSLINNISLPAPELSAHAIIAGGDNIARSIAHLMNRLKLPYLIIEPSYQAFRAAEKEDLKVLFGNPEQEVILRAAGIEHARILLAASPVFEENFSVIRQANKLHPGIPVVTRAETPHEVELLHGCQVFEIVQPKFEAGLEMTRQALLRLKVPSTEIQNYLDGVRFDRYRPLLEGRSADVTSNAMRSFSGLVELNWIKIPHGSPLAGASIAGKKIRTATGASVVGVLRGDCSVSNPGPDFVLEADDLLALIGTRAQCASFELLCGAEAAETPAAAEHLEEVPEPGRA